MKTNRSISGQMARALQLLRSGTPPAEVCARQSVSLGLLRRWQKRFDEPRLGEVRELRRLREENAKLKALIRDLLLDRSILEEVLRNS
jgi:putative transposase